MTLGLVATLVGLALVGAAVTPEVWAMPPRPVLPRALAVRRHELEATPTLRAVERLAVWLTPRLRTRALVARMTDAFAPRAERVSWPLGLLAEEWAVLSCAAAVGGAALGAFLGGVVVAAVAGGFAGAAPLMWLRGEVRRETNAVLRQFPDFLDALTLLIEAGMDFASAMERYAEGVPTSALGRHLAAAGRDLQAGARLGDVIGRLERDLDATDLKGFFVGVRETLRSGGSLAPMLRIQAESLRQQRFERAERQAAEAAVKLMLPLMLIFAAVLAIVLGPLAVQLLGGGWG